MGNKTYIGVRASRLDSGETLKPYTGVIVNFEDANGDVQSYTAGIVGGENVGSVLEVEFPWASQAIANSLLARVQGYEYTPFTARDARLDPAAELGDGVTVGGVYSVLASRTSEAVAIEADEIGADYDEEINHEFRYESQIERSIKTLNKASASLKVSVDEIIGEVTDGAGNWTALTINPQGVIITGSSGGAVEINGGQLKAGTVVADSIVANSLIQSPTIYGAEYLSPGGKSKLELAELDPYDEENEYPALTWSADGTDAHQIMQAYDIAGQILRLDIYGDYVMSYWGGPEMSVEELVVYVDLLLGANLMLSSNSYGVDEPSGTASLGQIYLQITGESVDGWYPAQTWVYGGE